MEDLYLYMILLLGLAWSILNRYLIPKINNLPPTPLSALSVIGYLAVFKQPIHRTLHHIASRHGPILLLHFGVRRVLLISSSSAAEELFSKNKNDVVFANRPKLVVGKVFGNNYTNLAWAPHDDLWLHLRHVSCHEVLPFHRKQEQHDSLTDEVKLLLGRLKFFHEEKKDVELKPLIMDLVINVMMNMFAGKGFCPKEMITEGKGMEPSCMLDYVTNSFSMTTNEVDVGYFMPILKFVSSLEQGCQKLQKQGDFLVYNLIKQIKTRMADIKGSDKKEVKVIEFLLARQKEDPKRYSDELIKGLVQVLMSAGTDTTVGVLEWAFSLLLNHPEVLQKAQKEIEDHVGNKEFLKQSDIEKLPYLRCIVKETLRMYPVAPLLVPHESSSACIIGGYFVPKGTMLMVNVWAIHNDPKIWDKPEIFKPERFENIVDEMDGFKLMPFGYGRRSCPGKHMAMSVITFVLGSLLQTYDWKKVVSDEKKAVDMTELTRLALFKAKPLKAVCHPRESMEKLLSQIKRVDVKENNHPCKKEVKNYVVYIALGLFVIMLKFVF